MTERKLTPLELAADLADAALLELEHRPVRIDQVSAMLRAIIAITQTPGRFTEAD